MQKICLSVLVSISLLACQQYESNHPYPTGTLEEQLKENTDRFGVNVHSYEFYDLEDTPAPQGYQPFYISHYGRHGSRSNWGDKDYKCVISVLEAAAEEGVLTPTGESLLEKARQVLSAYNGMDGRLTDRGEREHTQLAERMYHRYPQIWKVEQPNVISIGSLVPRCLVSMAAFTNSLTRINPAIRYNFDTGNKMQQYIDCAGDESEEFKAIVQYWRDSINQVMPYDSLDMLNKLFTAYPEALKEIPMKKWQSAIFQTCIIAQDFDIEMNVLDYMAFETAYYYQMDLTYYIALRMCNVKGVGATRIGNAQIGVNEVIASADSAIMSYGTDSPVVANLRFGHDFPLLCIVNQMGIGGVGEPMLPAEIESKWIGYLNICMASNLQLVFYRNNEGDILVKALYNEREHQICGVEPVSGPYYRWEDVKSRWQKTND